MSVINVFDPQVCDSRIIRVSWQVYLLGIFKISKFSMGFFGLTLVRKILLGFAGSPRDFLGIDFFCPHLQIPVT